MYISVLNCAWQFLYFYIFYLICSSLTIVYFLLRHNDTKKYIWKYKKYRRAQTKYTKNIHKIKWNKNAENITENNIMILNLIFSKWQRQEQGDIETERERVKERHSYNIANKIHKLQKFYWHEMEMKLGMRIW